MICCFGMIKGVVICCFRMKGSLGVKHDGGVKRDGGRIWDLYGDCTACILGLEISLLLVFTGRGACVSR